MALEKQMELFDDGGLLDEGGTVDEESGNDVPVGSLKKEVRDDIPAQLSEGEFVMPADVVRFHGLDKMMALRDEAKMGLARMEAMGQMGNADEAIIPDGVPFTIVDLEIADDEDEPVEMQVGGFVQPTFTPGGMQQSQFAQYQPQFTPYQMPDYTQPTMPAYTPPQQAAVPMAPTDVPQFGQFVTPTYVTYVNDAGNTIQIPVGPDGQPLIPVPAGFTKQTDQPVAPGPAPDQQPQVQPTTTPQPQEDPSDGREFGGGPAGMTMNQSKIAVLSQLDPAFGQTITGIKDKYKAPQGLASLSIMGGIGRAFKESSETRAALKDYDYDKLAADSGLTRAELDSTLQELTGEVYSGYRDPETGEVSGQKDPRSALQRAKDFISGVGKEEDFGDEFGNIADDGTMPTTTGVETARVTEKGTAGQVAQENVDITRKVAEFEGLLDQAKVSPQEKVDFLNSVIAGKATNLNLMDRTGNRLEFTPGADLPTLKTETTAAEILRNRIQDDMKPATSDAGFLTAKPTDTRQQPTRFEPIDTEGVVEEETRIQQTRVARNQRIQKEAEEQTQNYRNRGYTETAAKQAGQNKARADDEAREQTGEPQAKAVTDKYGNPVRSGSDGSVVTSNREQKDDGPEPDSRWCCSQMVHRGLWTQQHEFARLTVWSSKQPDWWKSGYHVWGKVLAKTFLRKKGFWTDVMQSFYDYHIRKKPYTWRTAIAHAMVYPGVFICGNIWTKQPKGVTLASFKELNG